MTPLHRGEKDGKVQGLKSEVSPESGGPNEEDTSWSVAHHCTGQEAGLNKSSGNMDFPKKLKNEGSPKEKGQMSIPLPPRVPETWGNIYDD